MTPKLAFRVCSCSPVIPTLLLRWPTSIIVLTRTCVLFSVGAASRFQKGIADELQLGCEICRESRGASMMAFGRWHKGADG